MYWTRSCLRRGPPTPAARIQWVQWVRPHSHPPLTTSLPYCHWYFFLNERKGAVLQIIVLPNLVRVFFLCCQWLLAMMIMRGRRRMLMLKKWWQWPNYDADNDQKGMIKKSPTFAFGGWSGFPNVDAPNASHPPQKKRINEHFWCYLLFFNSYFFQDR